MAKLVLSTDTMVREAVNRLSKEPIDIEWLLNQYLKSNLYLRLGLSNLANVSGVIFEIHVRNVLVEYHDFIQLQNLQHTFRILTVPENSWEEGIPCGPYRLKPSREALDRYSSIGLYVIDKEGNVVAEHDAVTISIENGLTLPTIWQPKILQPFYATSHSLRVPYSYRSIMQEDYMKKMVSYLKYLFPTKTFGYVVVVPYDTYNTLAWDYQQEFIDKGGIIATIPISYPDFMSELKKMVKQIQGKR